LKAENQLSTARQHGVWHNGSAASSQDTGLHHSTHSVAGAQLWLKSWGGPRFGSQHRGACAPCPAKTSC